MDLILLIALSIILVVLILSAILYTPMYNKTAQEHCLQTIVRAISTGFRVPYENITLETKWTDENVQWNNIIFDHWLILITINWKFNTCKIVCTYDADSSGRMLVKKKRFSVRHNIIDEAKLIHFIKRVSDAGYLFSAPSIKDKAVNNLEDAVSLANLDSLSNKDLFDLMFESWTHLPFSKRQDAEDFVKITAFLMRNHPEEMKKAIAERKNHR